MNNMKCHTSQTHTQTGDLFLRIDYSGRGHRTGSRSAGVTVKSVRPRIWSGGTDNASRFCPGGQITLADLVLPPQIWSG